MLVNFEWICGFIFVVKDCLCFLEVGEEVYESVFFSICLYLGLLMSYLLLRMCEFRKDGDRIGRWM